MLRSTTIIAAVVSFASVAYGQQGQVVSLYSPYAIGAHTLNVPTGGFVVTDAIWRTSQATTIVLDQLTDSGATVTPKLDFQLTGSSSLTYKSGLPFAGSSQIQISPALQNTAFTVTLLGYIPTAATGNVPAVSTWGLMILGLLIVTAGTIAVSRRKQVA